MEEVDNSDTVGLGEVAHRRCHSHSQRGKGRPSHPIRGRVMKLVLSPSLLIGFLLVAGQVRAEAVSTRLTREKTEDHLYSFTIKSEHLKESEAGEFFEFRVTVKTKDAKAPRLPNRSGELYVFNGKEF